LVEVIDINKSSFIIYAFEKAPGRFPGKDDLNDELFEKWGRLTGRMHALAKEYRPPASPQRRFEWYEDVSLWVEEFIPPSQGLVIAKIKEHIARLRALAVDADSYGLIHSDLHHSNFFINDGNIIPIDFDDCHYSWYATDIAMPLFYMLREPYVGADNIEFAYHFMDFFMRGYNRENRIDLPWMKRIPDFMKLREMDLYMAIHSAGEGNLDRWCRDFMKNRRNRIENDIPVIDVDFSVYA
jgi:Ser/Thr protein kinase RdoA (MazF antagonist)